MHACHMCTYTHIHREERGRRGEAETGREGKLRGREERERTSKIWENIANPLGLDW